VISVEMPPWLSSVGQWYEDFRQTSDEEVVALLARSAAVPVPPAPVMSADPSGHPSEVLVPAGGVPLAGRLSVPEGVTGLVILAHGSASNRYSPRQRYVAEVLHEAGLGTLQCDLLTPDEEADRDDVFDVPMLGERLLHAIDWLAGQPEGKQVPIGLFGSGTAAAAALWAAADIDTEVAAVVSRSGRPELTGDRLAVVRAPTLLLVGGRDHTGFDLNRGAQVKLRCPNRLAIVPGAGPLFEEPGTLESATRVAQEWLQHHVTAPLATR
jgi:putative phosphoribosyl transferase